MAISKNDIIEATIRCTSRLGLPAVTMSTIGKEVGILAQGLYNHFDSKDAILKSCFDSCNRQLAGQFAGVTLNPEDDLQTSLKKLWMRYFLFFVNHPGECCFYRQYRELAVAPPPKETEDMTFYSDPAFQHLWTLIDALDEKYDLFALVPKNMMVYYVRNITPYLARSFSDDIIPDTPENREYMWKLVSQGFSNLWDH